MVLTIDTNAYSALKRGNPEVRRLMEEAERLVVPVVVIGELIGGFRRGTQARRNSDDLVRFLEEPGVEVPPMDFAVADRYGAVVADLCRKGTPIPTNDIWIAAVALENGARLLTGDSHFEHVDGLIRYGFDGESPSKR